MGWSMKSISAKLSIVVVSLVVVVALVLTIINSISLTDTMNATLLLESKMGIKGIENEVESLKESNSASTNLFAQMEEVVDAFTKKDTQELSGIFKEQLNNITSDFAVLTDANGVVVYRSDSDKVGDNISTIDYIQNALKGQDFQTISPYDNTKLAVHSATPILDDAGTIIGALSTGVDLTNPKIVDELKKDFEAEFTIFAGDERVMTTVTDGNNRAVGTKMSGEVADTVIKNGKEYVGSADVLGIPHITQYIPLKDGNGKIVGALFSGVSKEQVNADLRNLILLTVSIAAVLVAVGTFIFIMLLKKIITKPLSRVLYVTQELANGNFNTDIDYSSNDEIGTLIECTKKTTGMLKTYVSDISYAMGEFAHNNFILRPPTIPFVGDFEPIVSSVLKVASEMTENISHIKSVAYQVSSGAGQVSSGAQELAGGTTQQSESVEELSVNISTISEQTKQTAQNAVNAREMANGASHAITNSNEHMQKLMSAMNNINAKSSEISKIIKTIEDIAFQTNILALNAAVEAARAGDAGKGFAVVADEVRNLAGKSAEAAKNTTTLIEESVQAINDGVQLAQITATDLTEVVENVKETSQIIVEISNATGEQASSINEIITGIDQISAVVQTNSATSEESAAASEELSSQAEMLRKLISKFKIMEQAPIESEHHISEETHHNNYNDDAMNGDAINLDFADNDDSKY